MYYRAIQRTFWPQPSNFFPKKLIFFPKKTCPEKIPFIFSKKAYISEEVYSEPSGITELSYICGNGDIQPYIFLIFLSYFSYIFYILSFIAIEEHLYLTIQNAIVILFISFLHFSFFLFISFACFRLQFIFSFVAWNTKETQPFPHPKTS